MIYIRSPEFIHLAQLKLCTLWPTSAHLLPLIPSLLATTILSLLPWAWLFLIPHVSEIIQYFYLFPSNACHNSYVSNWDHWVKWLKLSEHLLVTPEISRVRTRQYLSYIWPKATLFSRWRNHLYFVHIRFLSLTFTRKLVNSWPLSSPHYKLKAHKARLSHQGSLLSAMRSLRNLLEAQFS